jgi:hypothetical protein
MPTVQSGGSSCSSSCAAYRIDGRRFGTELNHNFQEVQAAVAEMQPVGGRKSFHYRTQTAMSYLSETPWICVVPVSAHCRTGLYHQNGNRKKASRDSPRECAGLVTCRGVFPPQRLRPELLTYGNVVRSPTQGNDGAETALAGWGARIRTWEWRNQNQLDYPIIVRRIWKKRSKQALGSRLNWLTCS